MNQNRRLLSYLAHTSNSKGRMIRPAPCIETREPLADLPRTQAQ